MKIVLTNAFGEYDFEILKHEICATGKWQHEISDVVSFNTSNHIFLTKII